MDDLGTLDFDTLRVPRIGTLLKTFEHAHGEDDTKDDKVVELHGHHFR